MDGYWGENGIRKNGRFESRENLIYGNYRACSKVGECT